MLQYQSNYLIQTGYQEIDLITNIENDSLSMFSFTNEICKVNPTYSITDVGLSRHARHQEVSRCHTKILVLVAPQKGLVYSKYFCLKFHFSFQIKAYFSQKCSCECKFECELSGNVVSTLN